MKTSVPAPNCNSKSALVKAFLHRVAASLGCALGVLLAAPALHAQSYYPNLFDISIAFGCHCGCGCNTNALDTNNPVSMFLSTTPVVAVNSSSAEMPLIGQVVPPHFTEFLPSCSPPLYGGSAIANFGPEGWTTTQSRINAYGYTPYEPVSFTLNHPLQFNLLDYWFYGDLLLPDPFSTPGDNPVPAAAATQCQPYPWNVNLTLQLADGEYYAMEQQLVTGYAPEVNGVQMETPVNYQETNSLLTVSLYCTNGGTTNILLISGANLLATLLPDNIPGPLDQTTGWTLSPNFFTNWDWPLTPGDAIDPGGPAGSAYTVQAALDMSSSGGNTMNLEHTNLLVRANRAYQLLLHYNLDGYNIESLYIDNTGVVPPCTNLQFVFYTDICSITPPTNHINQQLCYATNVGLVDIMGPPNDAGAPQNNPGINLFASGDGNLFSVPLTGTALNPLPAPFVLPVFLVNETTATFSKWATENLGLGAAYEYFSSPVLYPVTENCYETNNLTNDFVMCPNDPAVVKGVVSLCGPVDTNYYGGIGALSTLQFAVTPPSGSSAGLPYDPTVAPFPLYNAGDPADPLLQNVSTILGTGGASAASPFNNGGGSAITEFDGAGGFMSPNAYQGNYALKLAGLDSLPSTWNVDDLHFVFGSPVNLDYHVVETNAPYTNVDLSCGEIKTNNINLCFGLATIPVINVYPQPIPANLIYTKLYLQVSGTGPGYTVGPISTNGFVFQFTSPTHNEADVPMFLPEGTYQYSATVVTAGGSYLSLGATNYFTVTCGCGTNNTSPGTNTCTNGCITIFNPNDLVVTSCTNIPVFYNPTATDTCCSNLLLTCNPPSGSVFVPGTTTTVTTLATDSCGHSNACTFTVTVQCGAGTGTNTCTNGCLTIFNPNDIVVTSCTNIPVFYYPTATDACCSNVIRTCNPPSGSVFLPGTTTTVTTLATDDCGSSNNCSFTVTIECGETNPCPPEPLILFNTGVDTNGALLPGASVDPHYTLDTNELSGTQAFVVTNVVWLTNNSLSQWISPWPDGGNTESNTVGTFVYQMTFYVPCTNNAVVNGLWAVDNNGAILLNGNPSPVAQLTGGGSGNFRALNAFTITSGLVAGMNTLTFNVTNLGGPTGLRVQLTGSATCCSTNPCPTTNSISLDTGYNQNTNGVYSTGTADAFWFVTGEPAGTGGTLPRPATAITPNFYWLPALPDSQWISSYPTDEDNTNGEYDFETYFCLEPGATNLAINVCLRADDVATVSLNGHQFVQTPPIYSCLLPQTCGVATDPSWFLPGQQNVLHVSVTNLYGVAMGLNLTATLTGSGMSVDNPSCCRPLSGISGQKYFDLTGSGVPNYMDPPLPGWTIQISGPSGVYTTTTDANGYYYFQNLSAGLYTVTEVPQAGWTQTAPAGGSYTINLGTAEQVNAQDFYNYHTNTGCVEILCHSNIVANCTGGGAYVTYQVGATNLCTNVLVKVYCTPPSGTFFPVGTTTVNCTAVDNRGDWATNCSFTVTVEDNNPPAFSGLANKTVSCGTNWSFDMPTVTDPCGCSNFIVTALTPVTNGTCPQIITETWVATNLCNGLSAFASQTITNICCSTNNNPCCANCSAPYPISFTNTVNPGYNFLADNLCQGADNTVNNVLTNLPSGTTLLLWNFATQSYSQELTYLDAADAAPMPAGWYDDTFTTLSTLTLSPGDGFILNNPGPAFQMVIQGCNPGCPPPCEPPAGGLSLIGSLGVGPATWSTLFSCPPPCGAEMELWNGSGFTTFNYANGAWTPSTPVLAAGQSAFVTVNTNVICCTATITCPSNIVVAACTNVSVFYSQPAVTDTCCTNWNVVCTPPSGSTFPVGTNTVMCYVTDGCGNSNSCSFNITVQCAGGQVIPVLNSSVANQVLNINWTYQPNWHLQYSTDLVNWAYSGLTSPPPVLVNLAVTNLPPMQFYRLMFESNAP